jgi:hypothetical protein
MKNLIALLGAAVLSIQLMAASPVISEKALKSFKTAFASAEKVNWSEERGIYTVRFMQSGIHTRVMYNKEGEFLGSYRYYAEVNLPTDITVKLKTQFPNRTIFGVVEYVLGNEISYHVKMRDENTWINVKVGSDRSIEVTERYIKG